MKYVVIFLMILFVSCNRKGHIKHDSVASYDIIVIDSCQYIHWCAPYNNLIIHKANCNNPIHYENK